MPDIPAEPHRPKVNDFNDAQKGDTHEKAKQPAKCYEEVCLVVQMGALQRDEDGILQRNADLNLPEMERPSMRRNTTETNENILLELAPQRQIALFRFDSEGGGHARRLTLAISCMLKSE